MENDNDNIQVEGVDGISTGGKKPKISFKTICLEQYKICSLEGSKEMWAGGVRQRVVDGILFSEAIPNQIQIFINSVDMLKHLLFPHIQKHSSYIGTKINKFESDLVVLSNNANKRYGSIMKAYNKLSDRMGDLESGDITRKQRATPIKNRKVEGLNKQLEKERYGLYKELFGHLSFLLNKMGYFEEQSD